jgi:hypothetical protein
VPKPLPQAHIIPGNPGPERTTGRARTMARTGTISPAVVTAACARRDGRTRTTRYASRVG